MPWAAKITHVALAPPDQLASPGAGQKSKGSIRLEPKLHIATITFAVLTSGQDILSKGFMDNGNDFIGVTLGPLR